MPFPITTVAIPASIVGFPPPPGMVAIGAATVFAGPKQMPVAHQGSLVTIHGNPYNPKAPGYNPVCAAAKIMVGVPNVLVEGKPIAYVNAPCTCCQHYVALGIPNVIVGIT